MRASLIACVSVIAFALPEASHAQSVPLVWQTTFDCPEWKTSDYWGYSPGTRPCPGTGVGPHGGWGWNSGNDDLITAAANNPNGGGGRGFRHWRCDGANCGGGGIALTLPASYAELWGRFYMRYEAGFAWLNAQPHYTKDLYVNVGTPSAWVFGIQGSASWGIFNGSTSIPSSQSWASTMGGAVGDGQWHCYEWHIQHGAGARIEIWVDDAHVLNTTTNMSSGSTEFMAVGENQNSVTGAGSGSWYTDYDDFAFSTAGRIGCFGSAAPTPPAPAQNLRVQ
jgi:hypothetical protein